MAAELRAAQLGKGHLPHSALPSNHHFDLSDDVNSDKTIRRDSGSAECTESLSTRSSVLAVSHHQGLFALSLDSRGLASSLNKNMDTIGSRTTCSC
jgi:hypothetical protein